MHNVNLCTQTDKSAIGTPLEIDKSCLRDGFRRSSVRGSCLSRSAGVARQSRQPVLRGGQEFEKLASTQNLLEFDLQNALGSMIVAMMKVWYVWMRVSKFLMFVDMTVT